MKALPLNHIIFKNHKEGVKSFKLEVHVPLYTVSDVNRIEKFSQLSPYTYLVEYKSQAGIWKPISIIYYPEFWDTMNVYEVASRLHYNYHNPIVIIKSVNKKKVNLDIFDIIPPIGIT